MEDNIVTSSDLIQPKTEAPKKQSAPKAKKVATRNENELVAEAQDGFKFIFYSSGAGYITPDGIRFSPEKRIHLVSEDLANHLLQFENFRLPDQLELIEYVKEI